MSAKIESLRNEVRAAESALREAKKRYHAAIALASLVDPPLYIPDTPADHVANGDIYHLRLLGQALGEVLVALGGTENWALTGPQLLLAADDAVTAFKDGTITVEPTGG